MWPEAFAVVSAGKEQSEGKQALASLALMSWHTIRGSGVIGECPNCLVPALGCVGQGMLARYERMREKK